MNTVHTERKAPASSPVSASSTNCERQHPCYLTFLTLQPGTHRVLKACCHQLLEGSRQFRKYSFPVDGEETAFVPSLLGEGLGGVFFKNGGISVIQKMNIAGFLFVCFLTLLLDSSTVFTIFAGL